MKLPAHARYKHTGVDWLGDVPEHWNVKAIKWETPVLRGASPRPIDDPIYFDDDDGEYSWVRISDVTLSGAYLSTTEQKLSRLGSARSVKLNPGALFLSIAGSVGKPCITHIKCCIHDGFVYFPRFKGDAKFLYYLFASGEPYRGLGKLGTQLNLNTDTVGSIVAGFPELNEQRTIAAFLDRETERIDGLVAKKRELIERLREKRTALISRTVTHGLPPAAAHAAGLPANPPVKPSALDWLGDIPKHWEVKRLGFLVQKIGSGKTPKGGSQTYQTEGVMLIRSQNVYDDGLRLDDVVFIDDETDEEMAGSRVNARDVLLNITGTSLGRCAVVPSSFPKANVNQHVCIIRTATKELNPLFAQLSLTARFVKDQIFADEEGSSREGLNFQQVRNLVIPVPPLPEQAAIAAYLDEETAKLDALVRKVEVAVERMQEYRTALIIAAVTGKIDVREAGTQI